MTQVVAPSGSLLVFGGPYGNLQATMAVLDEARRRAIPAENVLCTGDLTAYCADPQPVIELIRASGIRTVMGNCEEALAAGDADCRCGYAEDSACAALAVGWYSYVDRHVDAGSRRWMAALPRRINVEIGGRRLAVVHGGITSINRFVFASSEQAIDEGLDASGCDGVIGGHCGLPFTIERGGRIWHNAGVIGMPANDGTSRVWFSVLTPSADGVAIAHYALSYDHQTTAKRMRSCGLPDGYAAALESGLWPSCDVLPAVELSARGRPITPRTVFWKLRPRR
jgi:predicted phosphodiesterase